MEKSGGIALRKNGNPKGQLAASPEKRSQKRRTGFSRSANGETFENFIFSVLTEQSCSQDQMLRVHLLGETLMASSFAV